MDALDTIVTCMVLRGAMLDPYCVWGLRLHDEKPVVTRIRHSMG